MGSNYQSGHDAEKYAARYLADKGFKIKSLNWRTKYCEIDIVAEKKKVIYLVEVKYRRTPQQGTGLDYITNNKLKKMTFAAELWVQENRWNGDYTLAALELSGNEYDVTEFIENLVL